MNLAVAIDVETTGFSFKKTDRILEIAGVVFDANTGETVATFDTLINPQRNIPENSSEIHGLTAAHVSMAPTFEEIAPWLAHTLAGKRLVAHNALFDVNFLNAEFSKANVDFTVEEFDCTCRLSGNSSLKNAAVDFELEYDEASHHGAMYDALLCTEIYMKILSSSSRVNNRTPNPGFVWPHEIKMPSLVSRRHLGIDPNPKKRSSSLTLGASHYVEDPAEACYLWRLSDFLGDLILTDHELDDLNVLANDLGITREAQFELHQRYVRQLEIAALRDGLVTESEKSLLEAFSAQLNVPLEIDLSEAKPEIPKAGSIICVTGTATIDGVHWGKREISTLLTNKGFVFTDELNKSSGVALLIQESEGSQSSKVEKARKWGIPRMTIETFIREVG